jgi:hypothetical protein
VSAWLFVDAEQPSAGFEYLLDARSGDTGGVFSRWNALPLTVSPTVSPSPSLSLCRVSYCQHCVSHRPHRLSDRLFTVTASNEIGPLWAKQYRDGVGGPLDYTWLPRGRWFHWHLEAKAPFSDNLNLFSRTFAGTAPSHSVKGMIAEVHLWDRALPGYTVVTVAAGFAAEDSVCCGLVAW